MSSLSRRVTLALSFGVTSSVHFSRSVSLKCTPNPGPILTFDVCFEESERQECFSIIKHSSSMEAKIFANINSGDDDEFSEYTGAGFFGKIFDISSKHLAAERVSKATLGEKKA